MCDDPTPQSERRNAAAYQFDPAVSPAFREFGGPFADYRATDTDSLQFRPDGLQRQFALAVVRHQFGTYLGTILDGLVKYVDPHSGHARMLEWPQSVLITELHNEDKENVSLAEASIAYERPLGFMRRDPTPLDGYAKFANFEGWPTVLLTLLLVGGWILSRNAERAAVALFGLTTLTLIVSPVALLFYGARYAAPMYGPLAAGAALGMDSIAPNVHRLVSRVPRPRGTSA